MATAKKQPKLSGHVDEQTRRIQLILKNGGQWMPPQTLAAFAANTKLTDDAMLGAVKAVRKAVVAGFKAAGIKPDDGWKQFTDDPILQKRSSLALAIKRYVSSAIGPWPIKDEDVSHIQSNLIKQGFGKGLNASGAWSPEWDAAWHQWSDHLYESQLAGDKHGSITFGKALHFMTAVLPKESFNAIVGTAKSLPNAARQLAADVAGGVVEGGALAANLGRAVATTATGGVDTSKTGAARGIGYSDILHESAEPALGVNVKVLNALGANTSRDDTLAKIQAHPVGQALSDVGTALILHDALKFGAQASKAIAEGVLRTGATELTQAEAAQAGGVIAHSVDRGFTGPFAGIADRGVGTAAERGPGAIGGLVSKPLNLAGRATENIPGLGRVGGWVGKLADADGFYYKARTLAATPYRVVPGLSAAGSAVQAAGIEGAKLRGMATVIGGAGSDNFRQVNTQQTEVLDAADEAIQRRLDFTILGAHIQPHLDDIAFLLHGPTHGPGTASAQVGAQVDDVVNGMVDSLGRIDLGGALQRATGLSLDERVAQFGGDVGAMTEFYSDKIYGHAANWWADQHIDDIAEAMFNPETGPLTAKERLGLHRELSVAARTNRQLAEEAVRGLIAQNGGEELAMRMRKEVTGSDVSGVEYRKGGALNKVKASRIAKEKLLPFFKPEVFNDAGFIADPAEAASLGLASVDSLTKQSAHRAIADIEARVVDIEERARAANDTYSHGINDIRLPNEEINRIRAAAPTIEEQDAVVRDVRAMLFHEFNIDDLRMPHDLPEKIGKLREHADLLASDAYPSRPRIRSSEGFETLGDVPHEVTKAIKDIQALGFKPVFGTDIGWLIAGDNQLDVMAGPITFRRKIVEHLGLSPDHYGTLPISVYRRDGIRNALNDLQESGKISNPDSWSADTILAYLEDREVLDKSPGGIVGGLMDAMGRLHVSKGAKAEARALMESEGATVITKKAVKSRAIDEITQALQLRDVSRKNVIEALTDPNAFAKKSPEAQAIMAEKYGNLDHRAVGPYTTKQANEIYRAIVKGSAAPKAYLLGMSRIDDLFRASMGIAGSGRAGRVLVGAGYGVAAGTIQTMKSDHPGLDDLIDNVVRDGAIGGAAGLLSTERMGWAMANLPNKLVQVRNDLRFALSPAFSFRRIAKTNVKLSLEGVTPVLDPLRAMEKSGTLAQDRARLRDVLPGAYNEISDDADRYLRENDVFGFYNARNYEAYALGEWARKNPVATIEEQRAFITKTFSYGTRTAEGRSALERTANFIFFPFSFEKTLYRNLGGYLLDHPAQQILLTKGLAAYNEFNQEHLEGNNPLAASWWEKHVPVLEEALRLNAFAHGISPGELGGINRPLLNMFLPQSWSSSSENLDTLHRFIPALKDYERVSAELGDQGRILETLGHNMLVTFQHAPTSPGKPTPVAESRQAQIEDGFTMQRSWYTAYADILNYNDGRKKEAQIKFPLGPTWGDFAGESITRDNVKRIIALKYPAFGSTAGSIIAIERQGAVKSYLLKTKGTQYGDYARQIFDVAGKLETAMEKPNVTPAQMKEWTSQIRRAAVWLASRDATFKTLYEKNLRRAFGPLEGVTAGG